MDEDFGDLAPPILTRDGDDRNRVAPVVSVRDGRSVSPAIHWFRRDLRLADNPALLSAAAAGAGDVLALFVLDPLLWRRSGPVRQAYLVDSLQALRASLDGRLLVRHGDPTRVVPEVADQFAATSVHAAADFGPYGSRRDATVSEALGDAFVRDGSPYAVAPGRVHKPDGTPYRVYTPFYRAWRAHGWRAPAPSAVDANVTFATPEGDDGVPEAPSENRAQLPKAGEQAAYERWMNFCERGLDDYAQSRDRPDRAGTSGLSAALKWGEIHPRTLLTHLGDSRSHDTFRKELAWREFYADVLHHNPGSAHWNLRSDLSHIEVDEGPQANERFEAWASGRTGYPFVDAGMRQLLAEGWMHNRVRMVVASFLVKDLHLAWPRGARHFMRWLRDGDLASNQHGWQWVAGTGTDAAPYFRVFNPVSQGRRFDPDGDYVRRYVPELVELAGPAVHEPWKTPGGAPHGYPERIVDHGLERQEALARYDRARRASG